MSKHEIDIINKLSNQAAEPSQDFIESLRHHLIQREQELLANIKPIRRRSISYTKLMTGIATAIVLTGVIVIIWGTLFKKVDSPPSIKQNSKNNSQATPTQTSTLPNQQVANLNEARKSLSFNPMVPSLQLKGETISSVKVGTKNNMLDDNDTLYVTYSDSRGTLYKISETTTTHNYPTEVQKVSLTINGKKIDASYYQVEQADGGNANTNSIGTDASSPTSYMFWSESKVVYEISEFGRVSKNEFIKIANSYKSL